MATILIVDDRPVERKFLSTLLTSASHFVVEAFDGVEALRMATSTIPDLVISDILMPTVDGYELVRQMRDIPALARTPVIFYTATYHEREARALALQCGVAAILTKPSSPKLILEKVDAVLAATSTPIVPAPDRSRFSEEHVRVVSSTLANKVEDLAASEQRMAAIVDVAHEVAAERDPQVMLKTVCTAARDVTLAQHAIIAMLDDTGTSMPWVATSGIDTETAATSNPEMAASSLFRPVVQERRPMRMKNPSGRPEAVGLPASSPPTYSILVVPMASSTRVYGCLKLRNKLGAEGFTDRDEEVALTLATHAGIAYENALLYDDLQHRTRSLETEVAERRRAEAALREGEERTRFALAAARMGVWEFDLVTERVTWSDTMVEIFGLTPAQAPKDFEQFLALIHPDDRSGVRAGINRALSDDRDYEVEFRAIWPDASIHHVYVRARIARAADGTASRMLGVGMDISERKSLEEQLRQAQKMEAVGQLAGGVAHDFNNLLTAIRGYADLLSDGLAEGDERHADVMEIIKASERAAGLTRQLLAFSRKQILQPKRLDLNALVHEITKMLRRLIGEDIELVTKLAPSAVPVIADSGQIEQILMNLAVNSRDAMPNGGRLSIETADVMLDDAYLIQHPVVRSGAYVLLAVSDNGTGMDAHTRSRVFEPFFTTKEQGRGTGLGLATVYGIVKQSGGYIWVYSEPGHGTTFKVYLPRADETGMPERTMTGHVTSPGGTETILLVEDERSIRSLSKVLLERVGYRVLEAAEGDEAVRLFRAHGRGIDLLVTDVVMPGFGGVALFRALATERPELKVLYMSGYTDDAVVHHTGVHEGAAFLQKPFTADALLHKVREALDRR